MATDKLTEVRVRALAPKPTAYKATDGGGMYLYVTPAGAKLWRLKYRIAGAERVYSIGAWPEITLAAARKERDRARGLIRLHQDPVQARREVRNPEAQLTVASLIDDWHTNHTQRMTEVHRRQIRATLDAHVIPEVGDLAAGALTPQAALAVIRKVEAKGVIETARRCRMWASKAYRYGLAAGLVQSDPWASITGALVPRPPVKHFASLELAEVHQLLIELAGYGGERITVLSILFTLLTWARTGEVRLATWDEVDLEARLWTVPAERMKRRREHVIPLSSAAMDVLAELKPMTGQFRLLFPSGRNVEKPLSENTMLYALYRLGHHTRATIHGFRSLASTAANESGLFRTDVIERSLAHVEEDKVRSAYNRAEYQAERRALMEWWAGVLMPSADAVDQVADHQTQEEARQDQA